MKERDNRNDPPPQLKEGFCVHKMEGENESVEGALFAHLFRLLLLVHFVLVLAREVGCLHDEKGKLAASQEGDTAPQTKLTAEIGKKIHELRQNGYN